MALLILQPIKTFNNRSKFFLTGLLLIGIVIGKSAQPQKVQVPEWKKFLFKTYNYVFVDSYEGKLRLDSLISDARKKGDTERMAHYNEVYGLVNYFQNDTLQAKNLFRKSEAYFKINEDYTSLGDYELRKGVIIMNKLKFKAAEIVFLKALSYYEQQDNRDFDIAAYYKLGVLYLYDNRQADAIKMYAKGLKLAEQTKNTYLMLSGNLNLGSVMLNISSDEKTGHYLLKAKNYAAELKDTLALANTLYYLSSYYQARGELNVAMIYVRKALDCIKDKRNNPFVGSLSGMMANIFLVSNQPDSAIIYATKALDKCIVDQNKTGILDAKNITAHAYFLKQDYTRSKEIYLSTFDLIKELGYTSSAANVYKGLAESEFKLGKSDNAYMHLREFIKINDSIFKQESQKQIAQVEASFQNEKKQMQIESLNRDKTLKDIELQTRSEKINRQNTQKIIMGIGLLIALVFLFFIWKGYNQKQKDNSLIKLQRDKMEEQKFLVEEKNTEILDSINYAKRLQDAILPSAFEIAIVFKETFIFYEPKEIVAGDFYWIEKFNGKVFLAVCDCTGHGVPGAMLSVIGHNGLSRCVKEFELTDPGQILDRLSEIVEETFSHTFKDVRDGMDVSLCVFTMANGQGEEVCKMDWAGANNPLWLINRKGEFKEIKGDKQPIGKHELHKPFVTHSLKLKDSDSLYLFTDGFADQFGGPKGKKYKYAQLKQLLLNNHTSDMQTQLGELDSAFNSWKGDLEQVDDVCIIGIRV